MASHPPGKEDFDPLYLHAKQEAGQILVAWAVCLVWTVGYCALFGYDIDPSELQLVFGMPSWIFWGVFVPWMTATVFSVWYGLVYMRDDNVHETYD